MAAALMLFISASTAIAGTIIDVTASGSDGSGTAFSGGKFFVQQESVNGNGSGNFDSFLRVKQQGSGNTEQGYNTGNNSFPLDDQSGPNFNTGIQLSAFPTVTIGGNTYIVISLDTAPKVESVNQLQIFQSTSPVNGALNTDYTISPTTGPSNNSVLSLVHATQVFQLNDSSTSPATGTNYQIHAGDSGNGTLDAVFYILKSDFTLGDSSYVTLFAQLGDPPGTIDTQGSYEEFGIQAADSLPTPPVDHHNDQPTPEPGSVIVWGVLGLAGIALRRRYSA